jgi:hypothetical protein
MSTMLMYSFLVQHLHRYFQWSCNLISAEGMTSPSLTCFIVYFLLQSKDKRKRKAKSYKIGIQKSLQREYWYSLIPEGGFMWIRSSSLEEVSSFVKKSAQLLPSQRVWERWNNQSWWIKSCMSWIKAAYLWNLGVDSWRILTQRSGSE